MPFDGQEFHGAVVFGRRKQDTEESGTAEESGTGPILTNRSWSITLPAMPRQARHAPGGIIYHVLNRAAGRKKLFDDEGDYAAFIRVLARTLEEMPMRVCAFCVMPNHWHLLLWPQEDGDLARFMQKLTIPHVRRWVEHRNRVGYGSVYQGRY